MGRVSPNQTKGKSAHYPSVFHILEAIVITKACQQFIETFMLEVFLLRALITFPQH